METLTVAFSLFGLLGAIIVFLIGQSFGHKKGRKLGFKEGREVGVSEEKKIWFKRAQNASDAGTPWAGVTLPVKSDVVEAEETIS